MVEKIPIGLSLQNSLLVALFTTSMVLLTGATVGYALAKNEILREGILFST
jgi:ABC-type glycerol-3-phosphate transport system permease component